MLSKVLTLLKAKTAIIAVTAVVVVGGATAAFAASPSGQNMVQHLTNHRPAATAAATSQADHDKQGDTKSQDHGNTCPGQADAQNLAAKFGLSTDAKGAAVTAICALHAGTFKGTTASGTTVSATRVYGYGEIDQLLTLAQAMDTKASTKLSDANVSSGLASALHTCASASSVADCLKDNSTNSHPGNGNGNGKPTATPTPHH